MLVSVWRFSIINGWAGFEHLCKIERPLLINAISSWAFFKIVKNQYLDHFDHKVLLFSDPTVSVPKRVRSAPPLSARHPSQRFTLASGSHSTSGFRCIRQLARHHG